ncbi:visual pigment-like receptor peropsin isoform X3 [Thunnus maccoyii]|uniref:visual pigment-like receptor peropsin isoform X3 n=1 Tax=Thunnus maccoyii TaxID=8240 RepID=UPI001C4D793E|nr:visual pigment-like receptor peropsin isoform X3 [Thunnus maccoyii]
MFSCPLHSQKFTERKILLYTVLLICPTCLPDENLSILFCTTCFTSCCFTANLNLDCLATVTTLCLFFPDESDSWSFFTADILTRHSRKCTGVISLMSNIVVLLMFVKFKELRTATNFIIINLAFTDIGVAGIGYPMSAASDIHGSWKFGYTGCQIYAALNIFFGMASIGLLTVVAIDRYLTICRPDIGQKMTVRSYNLLILAAWLNAVFWSCMPIVGWAGYAPDPTGATCTINWRKNDARLLFPRLRSTFKLDFEAIKDGQVLKMLRKILSLNIYISMTTEQTPSAEEDCVIHLKAPKQAFPLFLTPWQ